MTGRVALITGCGKADGSGQAVARALAADGAAVVVADRRPAGVPNRRQEIVGSEQPAAWSGLTASCTRSRPAAERRRRCSGTSATSTTPRR